MKNECSKDGEMSEGHRSPLEGAHSVQNWDSSSFGISYGDVLQFKK